MNNTVLNKVGDSVETCDVANVTVAVNPPARTRSTRSRAVKQPLPGADLLLAGSRVAAKLFDGVESLIRECGYRFGRNDEVTAVMQGLCMASRDARVKLEAIVPEAGKGEFVWHQCKLVAGDAALTEIVGAARDLLERAAGCLSQTHADAAAAVGVHTRAIIAVCEAITVTEDARVSTIDDIKSLPGFENGNAAKA
jgi:hypothetical protein